MKLTPEDLEKLEAKKLANVIRKLTAGKTLTGREESILARARGETQTPEVSYAGNWDELAAELSKCGPSITRRAIQEWRRDPRYKDLCPKDRADGRKPVAEWVRFMVENGLKGADKHVGSEPDDGIPELIKPPPLGGTQADWSKAETWQKYEQRSVHVQKLKAVLLEAAELEVPLGATLATIQAKLAQFPARVSRYLVGLRDVGELEDRLRDEIDADLGDLNSARYTAENAIKDAVAAVAAECRDDVLLKLAERIATDALRQLGRVQIAEALGAGNPAVAGTEASTGAATEESKAAVPAAEPGPASGDAEADAATKAAEIPKRRGRRKARPKPAQPPGEIEGSILATRKKRK